MSDPASGPDVERVTVTMPAAMAQLLRASVDGGEYLSTSEIVREALGDWTRAREADRRKLDELRALIQEGIDSGPGIPAEQVFAALRNRYTTRD